MAARGKLSSLNDQLIMLVEQQKKLADEFTHYLTDPKVCLLTGCAVGRGSAASVPCVLSRAGSACRASVPGPDVPRLPLLQDGLRENTRKAIKNLDAAVVASKQPGYFNYHEPNDRVKKVEQGNLLKKKLNEIKRVEKQIQHVREQMARCEDERKEQASSRAAGSGSQVHSLKQVRHVHTARDAARALLTHARERLCVRLAVV